MTHQEREDWFRRAYLRCERRAIVKAAVAYLEQWPWEWFGTTTFKPPREVDRNTLAFCKRHSDRLFNELSRWLYGRRWRTRGTGVFGWRVWHHHKKGAWHAHWLLAGTKGRGHFLAALHDYCARDQVLGHEWVVPVTRDRIAYVADYMQGGSELWEPFGIRWFDESRADDLVEQLVRECGNSHARELVGEGVK